MVLLYANGAYRLLDMISKYATVFVSAGQALAILGALAFIAMRVFSALGKAQPIDFYPLLRPFALMLLIMNVNMATGVINDIGDALYVESSDLYWKIVSNQKHNEVEAKWNEKTKKYKEEQNIKNNVTDPTKDNSQVNATSGEKDESMGWISGMIVEGMVNFMDWSLNLIFTIAAYLLSCLSAFFLSLLTILAPLAFGIAVWDGLHGGLSQWFTRYISVSLWGIIANLLLCLMAVVKVELLNAAMNFDVDSLASLYLPSICFNLCGIICIVKVPSFADWIVSAGSSTMSAIGFQNNAIMGMAAYGAKAAGGTIGGGIGAVAGAATGGLSKVAGAVSKTLNNFTPK